MSHSCLMRPLSNSTLSPCGDSSRTTSARIIAPAVKPIKDPFQSVSGCSELCCHRTLQKMECLLGPLFPPLWGSIYADVSLTARIKNRYYHRCNILLRERASADGLRSLIQLCLLCVFGCSDLCIRCSRTGDADQ